MDMDWTLDTTFTSDSLGIKTEGLDPFPLPFSHLPDGSMPSSWTDESPGMADSFLSLDFDSPPELSAEPHLCMSSAFSEPSPAAATPMEPIMQTLFSPLVDAELPSRTFATTSPVLKHAQLDALDTSPMADFTLFPKDEERGRTSLNARPDTRVVFNLLNTLNTDGGLSPTAPATAAPQEISSPPGAGATSPAAENADEPPRTARKRRNAEELLPIDAPIQPRTYHTESATSRRDSAKRESPVSPDMETSTGSLDGSQEMDARSLKRLSNTLAARRSRHRKAEELKRLHDQIAALQKEAAMWRERCQAAEMERDAVVRRESM